jgi:hypothetical protein
MRPLYFIVLVCLGLLLAACGEQAATPTAPPLEATEPPAPTEPAAPTEALAPTEPAAPTEPVFPIAYSWGWDTQTACLLGSTADGEWRDAEDTAPLLGGGETYQLYGPTSVLTSTTGEAPGLVEDGPCTGTYWVYFPEAAGDQPFVALNAPAEPLPRAAQAEDTAQEMYQEAVTEILRQQGITEPEINITQIFRVDLEGDGTEEVLLGATRYTEPSLPTVGRGDYSLVLLRRVTGEQGDQVETSLIEAQSYPQAEEFAAPDTFRIAGILDLNGDGVLEVVVESRYYEGGGVVVYALENGELRPMLSCGCGA